MARPIKIAITTSFDPAGARSAQAAIGALQRAIQQAGRAPTAGGAAQGFQQQARAAQQAQQAATQLALASQRLATAEQQTARAAQQVATETQRTAAAQARAEQAALRLAQAQERAAQSAARTASSMQPLPRTLDGLTGSAAEFAKTAASAFSVGIVASFAKETIDAANGLEDAKGSLKAIAGDQATYNKALEIAAQNQRLFGGSLAENINEMGSFVVSSRLAGVELDKLLDASQRLATLDPGQGAAGAAVALRELLSGNTRSLAARFELPAATIKAMGDESLTANQKLDALASFLDEVGITSDAVRGKLDNNSQAFRDLAAAGDQIKTSLGSVLAEALAPAAKGLAEFAQEGANAVTQLSTLAERLQQAGQDIIASSTSYEDYKARVQELNDALPPFVQQLPLIGEAAYNAQKGLQALGDTQADASIKAADLQNTTLGVGQAMDMLAARTANGYEATQLSAEAQAALGAEMLRLAGTSEENRLAVEALAEGYYFGKLTAEELQYSVQALSTATNDQALADAEAARFAQEHAAATQESDAATIALADSLVAQAQATDDSTLAGQAQRDALLEAADAAQQAANDGKGLEDQARAAALALLAAGGAGVAAAGQLAGSSGQVDILTAAYYRLEAARRAAGGVGAASALGNVGAGRGTGKGTPAAPTSAKGVTGALVAGQQGAFKPPSGGGGGGGGGRTGGGGGGGGSRGPSEAQRAQERLADIAADGAQRIEEINAQAAERLVEIDRRAAEERARISEELSRTLQTDAASTLAANEANDLDLVGADKEQRAKLEAREKAEAEAAARLVELQQQTRDRLAAGEVEQAEAQYEAAKQGIDARQKLDQAYYEKQAELAGNPAALAELDKQYQEAVKAQEDAARLEQEIAAAKAQEKADAVNNEKLAVIQAAEDQKIEVVKKAEEQAAGVKGAADSQKQAVVQALSDQATAATNWASETEKAAGRVAEAYRKAADAAAKLPAPGSGGGTGAGGGAGSGTKAAGGGTFVSRGPTTLTVGDNPGGVELVSVVPLSGKGSTSVGPGMARMAGGGSLVAGLDLNLGDMGAEQLEAYAKSLAAISDAIAGLRAMAAAKPLAPIDPAFVQEAVRQTRQVAGIFQASLIPLSEEQAEAIDRYAALTGAAVDGLLGALELRQAAAEAEQARPVTLELVQELAAEARATSATLMGTLIPVTEDQVEAIARYADAVARSTSALGDALSLRQSLRDGPGTPVLQGTLINLADEAQRISLTLRGSLIPMTEENLTLMGAYADAVRASVAVFRDVVDLRAALAEGAGKSLLQGALITLADDAQKVAVTIRGSLIPASEEQVTLASRYADAVGSAVGVFRDVAELRRAMAEPSAPLTQAMLTRLADDGRRVVTALQSKLLPVSEEQAAGVQRYADTVGASVAALRDTAGLTADLFDGYRSPSDAQIGRVAEDARRIADAFARAASVMSDEGAAQAERLASATQAAVQAARESLLTMQAINDQTFALDRTKLAQFEDGATDMIATTRRLAERAASIPEPELAALRATAEAVTATAGAFAALASVPMANLPELTAGYAGAAGGGGGLSITFGPGSIVVEAAAGMDTVALADQVARRVIGQITQSVTTRR